MPDEIATPAVAAPEPTVAGSGFLERAASRIAAAFPQEGARVEPAAPPVAVAPEAAPAPVVAPTTPVVAAAAPAIEKIEPEIDTEVKVDDLGLPLAGLEEAAADEKPAAEGEDNPATPEARAFKTLRTELKAANTTLETVRSELALRDARIAELTATTPDLPALQAKVEEYEKQLSVVRLQSSPAYVKAVEEPYQAVVTRADQIAEQYELDKLELSRALTIPDRKERTKALSALLTGVDETDRLDVHDLGREVEKIAAKERELISNSDAALKELEAEAEAAKQKEIAAKVVERKDTVAKVIPFMAGKLPTFRTAIEGLTDKLADTDLLAVPTASLVYNAAAGELLPVIIKQHNQTQRDLESALEELDKFRRATPGSGPGGPSGPASSPQSPDAGDGFQDRVSKRLKAAGMA